MVDEDQFESESVDIGDTASLKAVMRPRYEVQVWHLDRWKQQKRIQSATKSNG